MTKTDCNFKKAGIALSGNKTVRKYHKNTGCRKFDFSFTLKRSLDCGMISLEDVMTSSKEDIMKTILDNVHKYKIIPPNNTDGRYCTYVPDESKPYGRRQVRNKTLSGLYKTLLVIYGLDGQDGSTKTFGNLFLEWIEYKKKFVNATNSKKGLSPSTIRRYERDYDNYVKGTDFEDLFISAITIPILEQFFLSIIEKFQMSDDCAGNVFGYFNQAFEYAKRSKYISENPMDFLDKKLVLSNCSPAVSHSDEERILSKKQFSAFLKRLAEHEKKYPDYMPDYAAELACLTGMRVGEIAALQWSCIDDIYIHIDFSEHRLDYKDKPSEIIIGEPKNRKHRLIPITKEIRELLVRIKNASPSKNSCFLFVDGKGDRYTAAKISGAVRRHFNTIGVKNGSVHRIRRTVSSMLNRILSQKDVAALLGHSETVNDMFYNYSTANMTEKAHALTSFQEDLHDTRSTESA